MSSQVLVPDLFQLAKSWPQMKPQLVQVWARTSPPDRFARGHHGFDPVKWSGPPQFHHSTQDVGRIFTNSFFLSLFRNTTRTGAAARFWSRWVCVFSWCLWVFSRCSGLSHPTISKNTGSLVPPSRFWSGPDWSVDEPGLFVSVGFLQVFWFAPTKNM